MRLLRPTISLAVTKLRSASITHLRRRRACWRLYWLTTGSLPLRSHSSWQWVYIEVIIQDLSKDCWILRSCLSCTPRRTYKKISRPRDAAIRRGGRWIDARLIDLRGRHFTSEDIASGHVQYGISSPISVFLGKGSRALWDILCSTTKKEARTSYCSQPVYSPPLCHNSADRPVYVVHCHYACHAAEVPD